MKCPACHSDVPPGRPDCAGCGTPLPSAGEHPGSDPAQSFKWMEPPADRERRQQATDPAVSREPDRPFTANPDEPGTAPLPLPDFGEPERRPAQPPLTPSVERRGTPPLADDPPAGFASLRDLAGPHYPVGGPTATHGPFGGPRDRTGPTAAHGPFGGPGDAAGSAGTHGTASDADPFGPTDRHDAADSYGPGTPYERINGPGAPNDQAHGPAGPYDHGTAYERISGPGAPYDHAGGPGAPYDHAGGPGAPYDHAGGPGAPYDHAGGPGAPYDLAGGDPAAYDSAEGAKKRWSPPLVLAGVAVVAVIGGGLAFVLTRGSGNAAHAGAARPNASAGSVTKQAAAVNQVLASGRMAHGHMPSPLRTCDDVSAAVPAFQQVVEDRRQELAQAQGLAVDRLSHGADLRTTTIVAYQNSLAADQAYLAWAQDVKARACGARLAPLTPHYKDAVAANGKAGPAKRRVVALWNPIARRQQLPTYVWSRL